MAEVKELHIPCPQEGCNSSDGYVKYEDGTGFCFSCKTKTYPEGKKMEDIGEFKTYSHRGLNTNTLEKYGVIARWVDGEPIEVGFPYSGEGNYKVRTLKEKKFFSRGNLKGPQLFGTGLFEKGGDAIVITEGEYDAISVYQTTLVPSVSVKSSSSAKADVKANWDYINSFKKIILAFDNDDPGQKAAREVASLFDFNKVLQASFVQYKDANAYLQEGKVNELREVISNAKKFTPDNIISDFNAIKASLEESQEQRIATYPFSGLQSSLHGIHKGEVIVFKGDEGIGKTEVFRAIENHVLNENPENKIGVFHLEEEQATTVKGIATYHSRYPFLHPETATNNEEIFEAYRDAVGGQDDRVFIYESFDVEDDTALLDNIRFLVSACGCQFIFLDHISWLATGQEQQEDERRKLDRISQKLKYLAKELDFAMILISHTNDEGKTRGSRNITKAANTVVHMSRDKTSPVPEIRLKTNFMVEKARIAGGQTGNAGHGLYNTDLCILEDSE